MASTYVNNLRLEEIGTGEQSGTWGDTTNTNLEIIGQAVAWGTRAIANASTDNITIADGALDADRCLGLKLTGGGQACTVTLLPNTSSKTWFMYNATAAALTFTCGGGANVIIPAGQTKVIATDGLGSGGVVHDLLTAVNLAGITTVDDLAVTDDLVVGDDASVGGILGVTGVLTTTAATVFNGGFASNAASTITTADNLSGLIVASTDADANTGPTIQLKRDSSTTAANDLIGNIIFVGENNNDEATVYANIGSQNQVITDGSESGRFFISTIVGGTEYSRFFADATETVINENSRDLDFRVESNANAHAIFVNANDENIGFGNQVNITQNGFYMHIDADNAHLVCANTQGSNASPLIKCNRQTVDGDLISFMHANSEEGKISISGTTVSYNGFAGRHESSGIATNTAIGTVVSTIDELDVYPNTTQNEALEAITHPKIGQTRADHAKVKVSDSIGDKRVYGVVDEFNAHGKVYVTSVGIAAIKVTGSCAGGDLLESNGDGTAKVQSDDIVRSKTIGKVTIGNTDASVKLVSCVMYCG